MRKLKVIFRSGSNYLDTTMARDVANKFPIRRAVGKNYHLVTVSGPEEYKELIAMLEAFNQAKLEVTYEQKKFRW